MLNLNVKQREPERGNYGSNFQFLLVNHKEKCKGDIVEVTVTSTTTIYTNQLPVQ